VKGGPQVGLVPPQTFAAPPDQQAASEAQPNEPQEPGGQFGEQLSLELVLVVRIGDFFAKNLESVTFSCGDMESNAVVANAGTQYP